MQFPVDVCKGLFPAAWLASDTLKKTALNVDVYVILCGQVTIKVPTLPVNESL